MHQKPSAVKALFGILLLLSACFFIVACSQEPAENEAEADAPANTKVEDIASLKKVLEHEFTAPDKEFNRLAGDLGALQQPNMSEDDYAAVLESPQYQAYSEYIEKTYAPYFTENGFENFLNTTAFFYHNFGQDYQLSIHNLEIVQDEKTASKYSFSFAVNYKNPAGQTDTYDFEGSATSPEAGKIDAFSINDKESLFQKISEDTTK
ncbi:hypothetical protein [Planococcus shixiaomingii]|uniref:hypothetical protein n=1 Tax=Planococcus shixiaomingii TaxID=3058393 RepID=UPI002622334A|nr:hypothetical protein [Planococcus sp. N022]WKA53077.1 hypothetical protein QWY21_10415 [Planococcus sp. N022]